MEIMDAPADQHQRAMREKALQAVYKHAFLYRPEEPFGLSNDGEASPIYIAKYNLFSTDRAALQDASRYLADTIDQKVETDDYVLVGQALGAVPLVTETSGFLDCPFTLRRKDGKDHGNTDGMFEGAALDGEQVVAVDDTTTTGTTMLDLIEDIWEEGGEVTYAFLLFDRNQGGLDTIRKRTAERGWVVPATAALDFNDLLPYALEHDDDFSKEDSKVVEAYIRGEDWEAEYEDAKKA